MKGKVALLLAALATAGSLAYNRGAVTDTGVRGRIAFLAEMGSRADLRVVDVASGVVPFAIHAVPRQPPHWSPDGSRIVFVGEQSWRRGAMLVRANGSRWETEWLEECLRAAKCPGIDTGPVFSPDGTSIAFASTRDGNSEIYAIDLATRTPRRLTDDPAWDSHPTWSPDGKHIVFISGSGKSLAPHTLQVIGADGSGRRKLADNVAMQERPAWSPAGRQIAFVSTNPPGSLVVIDIKSGAVRRIADYAEDLTWSPDGSRLAFKNASAQVMVVNVDGTGLTDLTHNDRFNSYPTWSKDGAWITFVSGGCQRPYVPCLDTNHELHLMRRDGSGVVKLSHGVEWATHPEWSP